MEKCKLMAAENCLNFALLTFIKPSNRRVIFTKSTNVFLSWYSFQNHWSEPASVISELSEPLRIWVKTAPDDLWQMTGFYLFNLFFP